MTDNEFRSLALSHAGAVEGVHMGHADFRVGVLHGGKLKTRAKPAVFAALDSPTEGSAMLRLPAEVQDRVTKSRPETFVIAKGAWGEAGCTFVKLADVTLIELRPLMHAAWLARSTKPTKPGEPAKSKKQTAAVKAARKAVARAAKEAKRAIAEAPGTGARVKRV